MHPIGAVLPLVLFSHLRASSSTTLPFMIAVLKGSRLPTVMLEQKPVGRCSSSRVLLPFSRSNLLRSCWHLCRALSSSCMVSGEAGRVCESVGSGLLSCLCWQCDTVLMTCHSGPTCLLRTAHAVPAPCCSKIAEAEAGVSVNEKKWLVMHVHVQMRLDELRGPQTLGSL